MQIKSRMLLPPQEGEGAQEEEDPRQELVNRLLEYEKFKEIASSLRQRESAQTEVFKRPSAETDKEFKTEAEVYFEASIFELISAFSKALEEIPKELFYEVVKDEFTIEGKIHEILHLLLVAPAACLSEIFSKTKNKLEIIVTFLAILELIRLKEIVARQKELFGEIEITRNKENIIPYERRHKTETN